MNVAVGKIQAVIGTCSKGSQCQLRSEKTKDIHVRLRGEQVSPSGRYNKYECICT